jgi:hypothetical protein
MRSSRGRGLPFNVAWGLPRAIGLASLMVIGLWGAGCGSGTHMVSVFPIPGGRVASPQTQIAFRGVPVGNFGKIVVTGSTTGRHAGRVEADSDGQGGSFLPAKPFAAGELVTVRTSLDIRGARHGTFHFTIAHPAGTIPVLPLSPAGHVPGDELTFQSRPDLKPAAVELTMESPAAAPGDIFLTPQQGPAQNGAMIIGPDGALEWFGPVASPDIAADLRVQRYQGKPVLTWWEGYSGAGVGFGEDFIDNTSYQRVAVVHAANGLTADLHDFELTPEGTALITAYYPVFWNATSTHEASNQIVLDSVVQEIDIKTGLLLFQWDSLDHVPLTDTYEGMVNSARQPYDYFHVNSVQEEHNGDFLVSGRNTWAAYEIDPQTGAIVWTLGGKHSSYKLGSGVSFAFQHDVRLHDDVDPTVTLFDDGAGPPKEHDESRGITVRLNDKADTAQLVGQDVHSPPLLAAFEGSVQVLGNGDDFLGWGQQPYFTEFSSRGQIVFDGRFVDDNSSYRAYRFPWTGTPDSLPSVAASTSGSTTNVYVSWNGDTRTVSWRVLAGATSNALSAVTTASKQGFESQIQISAAAYVEVQALDSAGRTLATSKVVQVQQ